MTLKQIQSTLRWKLAWYANRVESAHPAYYWNIEPTSACNLRCTICSLDASRKKGLMDMGLFERLTDEAVRNKVVEVRLFLAGEPLIHPKIADMVRIAHGKGLQTSIHTNATHLTRELSREFIEGGLTKISFSFDGDNREEFERIRLGAKYDKVLGNILGFLEVRKEMKAKTPHTTFQAVRAYDPVTKGPQKLSDEFLAHFKELPIDSWRLLTAHNWGGEIEYTLETKPAGKRYVQCRTAWESMSIGWDGRVLNCCGDLNGKVVLGDVKTQTPEEVWNGALRNLRRQLAEGRIENLTLCNKCDAPWREHHPAVTEIGRALHVRHLISPLRLLQAEKTSAS